MKKLLKRLDWFKVAMFFAFAFVIGYLLIGEFNLPKEITTESPEPELFVGGWTLEREDGSSSLVDLPLKLTDTEGTEVVTLSRVLPVHNLGNKWIIFWNRGNNIKAYVEGVEIYSFNTENSRYMGYTSPFAFMFIPMDETYEGKTITIVIEARNAAFDEVYLCDKFSYIKTVQQRFFLELFLGITLLAVAVILFLTSLVLRLLKIDMPFLGAYSLTVIISAIWVLTNSSARQFIFPNVSTVRDIAFFAASVIPFPYLVALEISQKGRYKDFFRAGKILVTVGAFIDFTLYSFRITDFDICHTLSTFAAVYAIILVVVSIIIDIIKGRHREYHFMAEAYLGVAILSAVQMVMYLVMDGFLTGLVMEVGLIWGLVFTIISSIQQLLELNSQKNEALYQSKAKGEFLANMSHEIRTPINAVLGMDELILREAEDDEILGYAKNIKQAGTTLLTLINDILDFSKIENGKMDIIPVTYDTGSMINDLVVLVSHRAEKKGLKLVVDVDGNIPASLIGDDVRLKQVVTNLLTNAVKYTPEGQVTLSVKLKSQVGDKCIISFSVKDTGIGIKEEDKSKLFSSFQRVDEARNRNIEGTGLGLSITLMLLGLMGSKLELESEYEKGSDFFFEVEQTIVGHEVIGDYNAKYSVNKKESKNYVPSFFAPEGQILVVDDNKINLLVIKGLLKATGLKIDTAESGAEALKMMTEKPYHIIFMDHMMPNMDGIETRRNSLTLNGNLCKDSAMIILTANAVDGAKEMYLEEGFTDYLAKPVNPKELEKQILENLPEEALKQPEGESKADEADREAQKEVVAFINDYMEGEE